MKALLCACAMALVLASAGPAMAAATSPDYSRVASAYATSGGHLDACAFTRAQLEAALAGIPKSIASVVPDLKKAIRDGIAAHKRGDCKGRKPTGTSGAAGAGGVGAPPETTTSTTPATTGATPPPGTTVTTPAQPTTTTPTTIAPATPGQTTQPPNASGHHPDRTPLAIAAIAIGLLLLAALGLWGLARLRGWDSPRAARARHGWGEAGFRTTGVWAEFADWLRLGR